MRNAANLNQFATYDKISFRIASYYAQAPDGRQSAPTKVVVAIDSLEIKATARGSWESETLGRNIRGVVNQPLPPMAWVGQAVDVWVSPLGPVPDPMANAKFNWKIGGEVVAGYGGSNQSGGKIPFKDELNALPNPKIYWVDGGAKEVTVTVTLGNKKPITVFGAIGISRPKLSVTATTNPITPLGLPNGFVVQFGNLDIPDADPLLKGITFNATQDANSPPLFTLSQYQWVQLIDSESHRQGPTSLSIDRYFRDTFGFVLDRTYPYALGATTSDSPLEAWNAQYYHSTRDDEFKMYLMWKWRVIDPDAIPVPIQVVSWSWGFAADFEEGIGWTIDSYHSPDSAGQDTTEFPEWKANFSNFQFEHDD